MLLRCWRRKASTAISLFCSVLLRYVCMYICLHVLLYICIHVLLSGDFICLNVWIDMDEWMDVVNLRMYVWFPYLFCQCKWSYLCCGWTTNNSSTRQLRCWRRTNFMKSHYWNICVLNIRASLNVIFSQFIFLYSRFRFILKRHT